jgi:hypothetical protein
MIYHIDFWFFGLRARPCRECVLKWVEICRNCHLVEYSETSSRNGKLDWRVDAYYRITKEPETEKEEDNMAPMENHCQLGLR